jgi:hypothetical protein
MLFSGQSKPAQLTPKGNGLFDVSFTPDKEGSVKIDVAYAGEAVPNRSFTEIIVLCFTILSDNPSFKYPFYVGDCVTNLLQV